jgi:hypothetical protein
MLNPTLCRLHLELPYRKVNCKTKRSAGAFKLVNSKLAKRHALARSNFFIDAACRMR